MWALFMEMLNITVIGLSVLFDRRSTHEASASIFLANENNKTLNM